MPNYKNAKIYKLVSNYTDKIYVGSTTQKLSMRKAEHTRDYQQYLKGIGYKFISFELLELGPVDIILLEEYQCDNREQLHKRERYHIEKNNCVNKNIPARTLKEYQEANKDKMYKCSCGSTVKFLYKSQHTQTSKHLKFTGY